MAMAPTVPFPKIRAPESMFVTRVTGGFGAIQFMTVQAALHGGHAGHFRHAGHVRDRAVTRLTFYSCGEVRAVAPGNARQHLVDSHPRNGFVRTGVRGKFLARGFVRGDRDVALDALGGRRKRHQVASIGIRVAVLALQAEGEMLLVAVRKGLLRCGMRAGIIRNHPLGSLLTPSDSASAKKRGQNWRNHSWGQQRSEEHTSELQSHLNLVCRLLLEKKKKQQPHTRTTTSTQSP